MKNLITCLVVCVLSGATFAETWTVAITGKADFNNIQAAVDIAEEGDEIVVMPGLYIGDSSDSGGAVVDMMGKAITLRSHSSASDTFISGANVNQCIRCGSKETRDTVIQGFTLIFGGNVYEGGGILCRPYSSPTIIDCIITQSTASYGGGITCRKYSSPLIQRCKIFGNGDDGLYCEDGANPELIDCEIFGNADHGITCSGSGASSSPQLTNTRVCGNGSTELNIWGDGAVIDNGGNCVANSCKDECDLQGACCTGAIQQPCAVLTEAWCSSYIYGQYAGDFTDCVDESYCPANLQGDCCAGAMNQPNEGCLIDVDDLLIVIEQWGLIDSTADINGDGIVDVHDLLIVVAAWGPCE